MQKQSTILTDIFWPIATGLLLAILILLAFPDILKPTENNDTLNLSEQDVNHANWGQPVSYANAVRQASPAVVNIYTRKTVQRPINPLLADPSFRRLFNQSSIDTRPEEQKSLGSGVIVSSDGYILTNNHVIIEGADQILIQLSDGRQSNVSIIGIDIETDLAVLKTDLPDLKPIRIGNSDNVNVGDVVLAIGNPLGFGQTVTQGIVSATGRNIIDLSNYVNFIQTDAAINEGNSGGALVDAYGNLLGINTARVQRDSSVGLNFATPADIATKVVQDIVQNGKVVRGWMGIEAKSIGPNLASRFGIESADAMMITQLYPAGPAHRSGLEPGDIILSINDRRVVNGRKIPTIIANTAPGDRLDLDIMRNGIEMSVVVTLEDKPS